jgi:hypothetical protein
MTVESVNTATFFDIPYFCSAISTASGCKETIPLKFDGWDGTIMSF